jgi:ABC-type sugar transport system permease subunit
MQVFSRKIYLFALPAFILYTIFWVTPVLMSFGYSLTNWNGVGNSARYIGLRNYSRLLSDGTLVNLIKNTLLYALFTIVVDNVVALTVALILERPSKLTGLFRTVFYLPTLYSSIVIGYVWSFVYMPQNGFLAQILRAVGLGDPNLLGNANTSLFAAAFVDSWKSIGIYSMIYLAGLKNVSHELLEAGRIDGCNWRRLIFYVKLPLIAPSVTINVILGLINGMKSFDYIYLLTSGGPGSASRTIMFGVYQTAFGENLFGRASAIAVVAFLMIFALTAVMLRVLKAREVEA